MKKIILTLTLLVSMVSYSQKKDNNEDVRIAIATIDMDTLYVLEEFVNPITYVWASLGSETKKPLIVSVKELPIIRNEHQK